MRKTLLITGLIFGVHYASHQQTLFKPSDQVCQRTNRATCPKTQRYRQRKHWYDFPGINDGAERQWG